MLNITGKDLMLYIIKNELYDKPLVNKDGRFFGAMTVEEAALRYKVGISTIRVYCKHGILHSVNIDGKLWIFPPVKEMIGGNK